MKTIGIILAGGLSRRFGSPKAFGRIDEEFFYERAIKALRPHTDEIIVVTRPELKEYFPAELTVIIDLPEVSGFGPLAGILSAMEFVEADRYVVLPCDMPYVTDKIISQLIAKHHGAATAIEATGHHHPLISVWNDEAKILLRQTLEAGQFRVMILLEKLGVTWIDGDTLTNDVQRVFRNVNTPTDLE